MSSAPDEPKFTDTAERETRARIGGLFDAAPSAPQRLETPDGGSKRVRGGLLRLLRVIAVTAGVMYLIGWGLTIGGVVWLTGKMRMSSLPFNTMRRTAAIAPALAYRLPIDSSVSPDRAGVALARLASEPTDRPTGFTYRDVGERPAVPWRAMPLPAGLFKGNNTTGQYLPPEDQVIPAVKSGLSADQRRALRLIGTAPVWREFDLLARAGAVDIIGGRLQVPFGAGAHMLSLPIMRYNQSREMAVAAVSRAAWHMSEGRADSAVSVLRGVISVGALIVENAPSTLEQLIGTRVVSTGRDALIQLFDMRGDARGAALKAETDKASPSDYQPPFPSVRLGNVDSSRAVLLAVLGSEGVSRAIRFETVQRLGYTSCGRAVEVAFGASDVATDALATLKRDVARFESERAMLDVPGQSLDEPVPEDFVRGGPRGTEAIRFLSRLYFNPRIANCLLFPAIVARGS